MTLSASTSESTASHFRRIAPAAFRALYASGATLDEIGKRVGLSRRAVYVRAKSMGLSRGYNSKKHEIGANDEALFREMWTLGVGTEDIAAYFKISARTVANTTNRLGLAKRVSGQRPKMTLQDFFAAKFGDALARQAQIEQSHFMNAEMADKIGHFYVGSAHARGCGK